MKENGERKKAQILAKGAVTYDVNFHMVGKA